MANPVQSANAGGYDAFVSKIGLAPEPPTVTGISTDTSGGHGVTTYQNLSILGNAALGATVTVDLAGVGVLGTTTASASTGLWTFSYSGTTLPAGDYAFTATDSAGGYTSDPSQPYVADVDLTTPTVTLSAPSNPVGSFPVTVTVTGNLGGLPDGTAVQVQANLGSGFVSYASGTLNGGSATITVPGFSAAGTYPMRAIVTDLAGNQGTSSSVNVVVNSVSGWVLNGAQVLAADPLTGLAQQQLGDVATSHALDLDRSPGTGQSGNPALVYNSDEVSAQPVIQASLSSVNTSSLPSSISAILTWNGTAGATLTYSTTGDEPGEVLTLSAQVPSAVTSTNAYPWSLEVLVPGQSAQTVSGYTFVVAEDSSPFGAGWTFSNTSQLFPITASGSIPAGELRVFGTGGYRFYQLSGSSYLSPAGDNGTLTKTGTTFTYSTPDGQSVVFNSAGMETSWTSPDGQQILTYTYSGSDLTGMTAIDGALTTFSYSSGLAQTIQTGSRTVTLSYTGTDLTKITNPDGGVHTFSYDGNNHLTGDTFANVQDQWAYANGMLATYTLGGSGSPTTTAVQPAAAVGLAAAVGVAVQASETDADSDKTTWQLDSQGRPLVLTAADNGVTTYTYSNGYLATETDPPVQVTATLTQAPVTTYTRDADGYVTEETLPDGSVITYQYQSAFHALTTMTDERGETTTYAYDGSGHLISETNALGQTTTYTYNAAGEEIAVTDPLGHTTSYAYDGDRRLVSTTDPLGNITSYTYDSNGNPQTTEDARTNVTTTIYDVMGRETGTINALGGRTTMTYLANGLLLSQTDQLGDVTTYGYDSYNRGLLTLEVVASGSNVPSDTAYTYDSAGRQTMVTDPTGAVTTTAYDPVGRVISTTNAQGNTSLTQYDLAGDVVATRDVLGRWTTYTYNLRGEQVTMTDPLGNVTSYAYDLDGNQTTVTDPLGHVTTTAYDVLNRPTVVTDPTGAVTTTAYDGAGNTLSVTDPNGTITSYAYDKDNRRTVEIDAYGTALQETTTTVYDAVGNVLAVTNALGQTTSYAYDQLNRQTSVTDPQGNITTTAYDADSDVQSVKTPLNLVTTYGYDAQQRQIAVTNPLNQTTNTVYNAKNNTAATVDPEGNSTVTRYNPLGANAGTVNALGQVTQTVNDAAGNVLSVTDADGNVTTYVYDADNRPTEVIDPNGAVTTTAYDKDGNVMQVTDQDGRVITYAYDKDNRETGETWLTGSGGSVTNVLTFTYDPAGNELTAANYAGTISYTYDALDRVATQTDVLGLTLTYSYDALNRQVAMQDSLGGTLTAVYDSAGNLTSQQFGGTGMTQVRVDLGYDSQDRLTSLTRYTNLSGTTLVGTTAYGYDSSSDLTSITNKTGAGVTLSYYDYTYNTDSLVATETHSSTVGTTVYSGTNTYAYDATGQLLTTGAETFSYDANGNRNMSGYQTSTDNETTNDGTYTYTYDQAGNLIEKSEGAGLQTWYYTYDNKNELLNVRETSNGTTNLLTITYTYDALGNQVQQAEWQSGGSLVTTCHAFDDNGNAWADVTPADVVVMRYIRAASTNQLLAQIDGSGNLSWYLTDNLGSVRDIVSAAGTTVTDHIDYGAFGNITLETNSAATGRGYLYTGMAEDRATGIVQAQHRTLLAAIGQWMQEDPIAFRAGDPNLRRYVGNNSANKTDPSGLITGKDLWAGVESLGNSLWSVGNTWYGLGQVGLGYVGVGNSNDGWQTILNGYQYTPIGQVDNAPAFIKYSTYLAFAVAAAAAVTALTCMFFCFPAGTLVDTSAGPRPIETIEIDNEVWSFDIARSEWRLCKVLRPFNSHYEGRLVGVKVSGETIEATPLHPVWVSQGRDLAERPQREHLARVSTASTTPGRWVDAIDLMVGDQLLLRDGRIAIVEELRTRHFTGTVYNLSIDNLRTYAVGKNGVLAHNANGIFEGWGPDLLFPESAVDPWWYARYIEDLEASEVELLRELDIAEEALLIAERANMAMEAKAMLAECNAILYRLAMLGN